MSHHYAMNKHLQRIGIVDSNVCSYGNGFHDIDYVILPFVDFEITRPALLSTVQAIGRGPEVPIRDVLGFSDYEYARILHKYAKEVGIIV